MSTLCSICKDPGLSKLINGNLDEKVSYTGISRSLASFGLTVDPQVISRHAKHYQPDLERKPYERKHDFAVKIRDRLSVAVDAMEPIEREDGTLIDPIMHKDFAPAIGAGLKAQAIIDKRELVAKKESGADVLRALLVALRGGPVAVALLDDGNTVEGIAVEVQ